MIRQGDIIDGRYKILDLIGRGGMSKVWLAIDINLNKQWAVKEIDKSLEEYKGTVNEHQTLTEIELMKKLNHPALPRIVSIVDKPSSLAVVMDYIEGETLLSILKRYGRQKEEAVVSWMLEASDVLKYLHSQDPPIIYRDMKPSNIMLSREGHIKIIDFGIAREYSGQRDDTLPLGTRGYASPEHFTKHTDARSDVYTLGTTMYQLLTGRDPAEPPYKLLPIRQIDESLSSGLEKIIKKATEQNPEDRYQSVQEFANALASYKKLDNAYIETLEKRVNSHNKKRKLGIGIIILGLILTITGSVLTSFSYTSLIDKDSTNIEKRESELKKAISLKPGNGKAYQELIYCYAKDGKFTEKEAAKFQEIYFSNQKKLKLNKKSYRKISYEVGENFLKYYTGETDNSSRAKLMQARPYFLAASKGNESFATLAKNYVFMADYYTDYILADDTLLTKEAGDKEFKELYKNCNSVLDNLSSYKGSGKTKMSIITADIMLDMIEGQRLSLSKAGIKESEVTKLLSRIESFVKDNVDDSEREDLLKSIKDLNIKISDTYKNQDKRKE